MDSSTADDMQTGVKPTARRAIRWVRRILNIPRLVPHILLWYLSGQRHLIHADVARWAELPFIKPDVHCSPVGVLTFIDLMSMSRGECAFRNLFYHRTRRIGQMFSFLCWPDPTLHIRPSSDLGPGLYIAHGWDAVVGPRKMGKNGWIQQQVTIAFTIETGAPTIGDNVFIGAGARIIGGIRIGNNVVIGAGTVVVKDVPDDCVVVGGPSYIVRRGGQKVREQL